MVRRVEFGTMPSTITTSEAELPLHVSQQLRRKVGDSWIWGDGPVCAARDILAYQIQAQGKNASYTRLKGEVYAIDEGGMSGPGSVKLSA